MQLRQIEVFHAFMITGSTVAAAAMLSVTQPAVSTTLKRMQDELRLTLFRPVKGRLVPTPEAHVLFRQVRAIHEDIGQLERLARTLAEGRIGHIRFGAVPAISEGIAARAVADLRAGAPDVQIAMEVLNSHELVHRLQAGRLDMACVFGAPEDLPLLALERFDVELLAVVPAAFADGRPRMTLAELAGMPAAAMRSTDPIGRRLQDACRSAGVALEPVVELRSCRAAVALAREGVAAGIADRISIAETPLGEAKALSFSPRLEIPLAVVVMDGHVVSTAEARLAGALARQIARALA